MEFEGMIVNANSEIKSDNKTASHISNGSNINWAERPVLGIIQLLILTGIIVYCLVSLTLDFGPRELYTTLLGTCLGALLPNPKLKNHGRILHNFA